MAFPSDRISKTTKYLNVHFFIHSFARSYELTIDNALAVQNAYKLYQPIP
jgi:hypothetical protein